MSALGLLPSAESKQLSSEPIAFISGDISLYQVVKWYLMIAERLLYMTNILLKCGDVKLGLSVLVKEYKKGCESCCAAWIASAYMSILT